MYVGSLSVEVDPREQDVSLFIKVVVWLGAHAAVQQLLLVAVAGMQQCEHTILNKNKAAAVGLSTAT